MQTVSFNRFDVILDCTGQQEGFSFELLKPWSNAKYVTLSPPALRNMDAHGIVAGLFRTGIDLLVQNSTPIMEGKTMRWGFFVPSSTALNKICSLIRDHKVSRSKILFNTIYLNVSKVN